MTTDKAMSFIVAITGGRDFSDYEHLYRVLSTLHRRRPITEIRNGGMTGADALSSRWAYEHQVDTSCYGARWGHEGRDAGPDRSRRMLSRPNHAGAELPRYADLLVAFPGGRGTDAAVKIARELKIPVVDHRGDKD